MKPLHRHLVNTSRKVLCTAALAASLTTAAVVTNTSTADAGESEPTPDSPQATDRGDARLDLPDNVADPAVPPAAGAGEGASGIPATALDAYKRAQTAVAAALPNCKLPWELLAGIGRVESVHASGYGLKADGYTERPIRGPQLNGQGFAEIKDTDKGEWDGDAVYDKAVGPMQFIPSTWATWGADGNGDSKRDPNNIYDAALGAGLYLCAGDRNLSDAAQLDKAILSYNNSREYVNTVVGFMRQYQSGATQVPNPPAGTYQPPTSPVLPNPRTTTPTHTTPGRGTSPTTTPGKTTNPTDPAKPTPKPEPEKPTPTPARLAKLEAVGSTELRAEAGSAFTAVPRIKAVLSDGKPAANQFILFAVEDDTTDGTNFGKPGKAHLAVQTDAEGVAAAPGLVAGVQAGTFTLRATGYDTSSQFTVNFKGFVAAKPAPAPADLLTRSDAGAAKPLEVVAGQAVKGVEVQATAGGKAVAGTRVTAGLVEKNEAGQWVPVDPAKAKGPWFKGAKDGEKLFSADLGPSGVDGKIVVPELLTGDVAPGTYHLRLITKENVVLVLDVKVTAAQA